MAILKETIQSEVRIQCYSPANNETMTILSTPNGKAYAYIGLKTAFIQISSAQHVVKWINLIWVRIDSKAVSRVQVSNGRIAECNLSNG